MKVFRLLYRAYEKFFRIIDTAINHFRTYLKFRAYCDSFYNFTTCGVPYVYVSRAKGSRILIGKNLVIKNGMNNNVIGFGHTPCALSASGCTITIGDNVGMSQASIIAINSDVTIGDYTMLGGGVRIYSSDFHPQDYLQRRDKNLSSDEIPSAPVLIGNDCFIGAGTVILKGVSIGNRSIIGAGSVVTKPIPEDCVAAGNPCKVIRYINTN